MCHSFLVNSLMLRRGFTWQLHSSTAHPDFNLTSNLYRHSVLRSPLIHLSTKDTHKACAVLFRTTPENDRGAPHCLEHLVLCGSQRYPVRDPFFSMLNRSLNTYMNAWTGPDFTAYPFSTLNSKDFENLLRVYLDSVLFPRLRDIDFKQEAVRLEMTEKGLVYGGVVFNEMKGAMTEPQAHFLHQLSKHLYPGTTYQYNSGGDPEAIPQLTNAELKAFHRRFYHPSNSTIFLYGDMDISRTLALIDEEYFHKFQYQEVDSEVKPAKRLSAPIRLKQPCAPSPAPIDPAAQAMFAVSFLCDSACADPYTAFCLSVLSAVLHDGQKSPLYLALLESGLGKEYVPGAGFDHSTKEAAFTMGVNGCKEAEIDQIAAVINTTLRGIVDKGVPTDLLESAIHQIEIKQVLASAERSEKQLRTGTHQRHDALRTAWRQSSHSPQYQRVLKSLERGLGSGKTGLSGPH